MENVLIIGASNIDYIGKSVDSLIENDSNIGHIRVTFGGVARNVCENLARLNINVTFITAIGKDVLGEKLQKELKDLNVDIINPDNDLLSSSYMAIHDNFGEMRLAISDEEIIKIITIPFLESNKELISKFKWIIIDANLEQATIDYLLTTYKDKYIIVDGISTTKVMKFKSHLDCISLFKCNLLELNAITKKQLKIEALIRELLETGVRNVIITNGSKPICYTNNYQIYYSDVIEAKNIVSVTGAGDAMLAGIVYSLIKGESFHQAINDGKKLALSSLESFDPVNKSIKEEMLRK